MSILDNNTITLPMNLENIEKLKESLKEGTFEITDIKVNELKCVEKWSKNNLDIENLSEKGKLFLCKWLEFDSIKRLLNSNDINPLFIDYIYKIASNEFFQQFWLDTSYNLDEKITFLDTDEENKPFFNNKTEKLGVIEVSAAVRRDEIEAIKESSGIDIVKKLEKILSNEILFTLNKGLNGQIFTLCENNMKKLDESIKNEFDIDLKEVKEEIYESYENKYSEIINSLIDLVKNSNFDKKEIAFNFLNQNNQKKSLKEIESIFKRQITNKFRKIQTRIKLNTKNSLSTKWSFLVGTKVACFFQELDEFKKIQNTEQELENLLDSNNDNIDFDTNTGIINISKNAKIYESNYLIGSYLDMDIWVDPFMDINDNSFYMFPINRNKEQGLLLNVSNLTLSVISEATTAPRMFIRANCLFKPMGKIHHLFYKGQINNIFSEWDFEEFKPENFQM